MGNRKKLFFKCLLAALLGAVCIPLDSIDVYRMAMRNPGTLDIHYFWMNSIIYGGIYGAYFIYILAAIPFADNFCREYGEGIWRYLAAREGTGRYAMKRFGCAFLCGGVAAAGSGVIFLLSALRFCPLFLENRYIEVTFLPFSELLKESPWQYFLIMLYLLFLSGGFWSCIAYSFSAYVPVRYLICLIPYVFSFLMSRFCTILEIPAKWRLDFLMCGRAGPQQAALYLFVLTAMLLLILCVGFALFYRKVKWRIANE